MELLLTGSRDQALLAMVIEEAANAARETGTFVGRTAIQKVMYYLKVRGVKMSYKFDIYHYGPFCQDIADDIDWLVADNVIKDNSKKHEFYSNYAPDAAMPQLMRSSGSTFAKDHSIIQDTVRALIPLPPRTLELIATLDYLLRAEKARGTRTGLKDAVVGRFLEVKKAKFDKREVEEAFDIVSRMCEVTLSA